MQLNTSLFFVAISLCIIIVGCKNNTKRSADDAREVEDELMADGQYIHLDSTYDNVEILRTKPSGKHRIYAINKDGKWGVTNTYGGGYLAPMFDDFASTKNSLALKKNGKWSIYNNQYEVLAEVEAGELKGHHESHYIATSKGKKALVNIRYSTEYMFDEISGPAESEGYFYGKSNSIWKAYELNGLALKELSKIQKVGLKALNEFRVTLYGYGPIRIGMDIREVGSLVGIPLLNDNYGGDCDMYNFASGFPRVTMLCEKNKGKMIVERIYINDTAIKTKSGIGIGSSEAEILEVYREKMHKEPHKYNPMGSYYYYVPVDKADQNYRLNFDYEVDNIRSFSVGRIPAILYVEGCF